jgi:Spy/CpxP family protein refolding chaperone
MKHAINAALLSTCALMLFAGSSAVASPGGGGRGGGGDWEPGARLMHLVKRANLTPQQETQIQDIRSAARAQEKALKGQWVALHQQLADKILAPSAPTLADFASLTQQMEQVHSQQLKLGLQTAIQIRAVLTPAQVTHIAQIRQQLDNLNAQTKAVLDEDDAIDAPTQAPTEYQAK